MQSNHLQMTPLAFRLIAVVVSLSGGVMAGTSQGRPDFNRDVRPILAEHCLLCHGPDEANRQGGLRLDTFDAARIGGDSELPAITPGDPEASQLLERIDAADTGLLMPPPEYQKPLTDQQKATLREWIRSGAEYQRHWSFEPPRRPELSSADDELDHPIDRIVRNRLAARSVAPAAAARPEVLCRRLYLDLIGIPPSLSQVDEFVSACRADRRQAVATLVDSLLESEQFGVRWAKHWLDLARYADSHGFQRDDLRDVWLWRDWVVNAMNADMPFDQFTIEQLAGDLLPHASDSQRIATGFNRNATCNVEAGTEPEENRVNQVLDRVNTVGAVWLGLTLECAQCHDHKFDPITMNDYYRLFAFFNNTELEADRANPDTPGSIRFLGPYRDFAGHRDPRAEKIEEELRHLRTQLEARRAELDTRAESWEVDLHQRLAAGVSTEVMDVVEFTSKNGASFQQRDDGSVLLSGDVPPTDTYTIRVKTTLPSVRAIRLDVLADTSLPGSGPGRGDAERPNFVLNAFRVRRNTGNGAEDRAATPLRLRNAWASFSQKNFSVASLLRATPPAKTHGWAINPQFHQSHWAVFEFSETQLLPAECEFLVTLVQNYGGGRTIGRLRLTAVASDPELAAIPDAVSEALRLPLPSRTDAQQEAIRRYQQSADPRMVELRSQLRQREAELTRLPTPRSLVMVERDEPRVTHLLNRGVYTDPGPVVTPGTPQSLHPFAAETPTRLDLARWLVSPDNPLTARVVVNRWWAELFGEGLVTTPEDFGMKGDLPLYPELLDWLALELQENGWSMKHVLRQIVTSDTYQQSSGGTAESFAADRGNRWLARGPRFRMDAEMIRDNALAIAGLLSLKQGGPSVRPPQPAGLWDKVGGEKYQYAVSEGERQYRRGLYVVLKRGSPYPSFVNFDTGPRMSCVVRRSRSNTPLQALTLLNDPVYVEAAEKFAGRIMTREQSHDDDQRLRWAFRTAVARPPDAHEMDVLRKLLQRERNQSGEDAAWLAIAVALLNLDEVITKG